jgi:hypothetical protein
MKMPHNDKNKLSSLMLGWKIKKVPHNDRKQVEEKEEQEWGRAKYLRARQAIVDFKMSRVAGSSDLCWSGF